jgi:predicted dehydrogenase
MSYSDLTLGMIGLGERAVLFGDILEEMGVTMVGTDIEGENVEIFTDRFDTQVYDTIEALVELPLDGVVVTTPNRYHRKPVIEALSHGHDVLLEKPVAHDVQEARSVLEATRQFDSTCYLANLYRLSPLMVQLRERIRNGEFGTVYHVSATRRRNEIPAPGTWMTNQNVSGGGALIDIGSHLVDGIFDLLQFPEVLNVQGRTQQVFDPEAQSRITSDYGRPGKRKHVSVEDTAAGQITFEGGTTASFFVAWEANHPPQTTYEIYGAEKGATVDLHEGWLEIYARDDDGSSVSVETTIEVPDSPDPFYRQIDRRVLEDFLHRRQSPPRLASVGEGVAVQRLIEALYRGRNDSVRSEVTGATH